MASVESSRVKKKYIVVRFTSFTPNSPYNTDNTTSYNTGSSLSTWVSGAKDTTSSPFYGPVDDLADAISYAEELNNNRVEPSGDPTYLAPGLPQGYGGTDNGLTYFWGVMEIWAIDPAVDPS